MKFRNLLIISNNFPDKDGTFVGGNFVKEQVNLKNIFGLCRNNLYQTYIRIIFLKINLFPDIFFQTYLKTPLYGFSLLAELSVCNRLSHEDIVE